MWRSRTAFGLIGVRLGMLTIAIFALVIAVLAFQQSDPEAIEHDNASIAEHLRLPPTDALYHAGIPREHIKSMISEANGVTVIFGCDSGRPAYNVLTLRNVFEFDSVTEEFVAGVILAGREGFAEWEDGCATLAPQDSRPIPLPSVPQIEKYVVPCYDHLGIQYYFDAAPDSGAIGPGKALAGCLPPRMASVSGVGPCNVTDAALCTEKGGVNYEMFDAVLHNECNAVEVRSLIAFYGLAALSELEEQCAGRGSMLYTDDCPGTTMVGYDTAFDMTKPQSDTSFHLQIRGGGSAGIRSLTWTNKGVREYGALACASASCHVSSTASCWLSPRWAAGSHSGYSRMTEYVCGWSDRAIVHVSGNFRGSLRFQGTLQATPTGCTARLDGWNVYIERNTFGYCDAYIQLGIGGFQVGDATLRNGCD